MPANENPDRFWRELWTTRELFEHFEMHFFQTEAKIHSVNTGSTSICMTLCMDR